MLNGTAPPGGTGVAGIADRISQNVKDAGFKVGAVDNAGSFAASTVMWTGGGEADAEKLAEALSPVLGPVTVAEMTAEVEALAGGAEVALVDRSGRRGHLMPAAGAILLAESNGIGTDILIKVGGSAGALAAIGLLLVLPLYLAHRREIQRLLRWRELRAGAWREWRDRGCYHRSRRGAGRDGVPCARDALTGGAGHGRPTGPGADHR